MNRYIYSPELPKFVCLQDDGTHECILVRKLEKSHYHAAIGWTIYSRPLDALLQSKHVWIVLGKDKRVQASDRDGPAPRLQPLTLGSCQLACSARPNTCVGVEWEDGSADGTPNCILVKSLNRLFRVSDRRQHWTIYIQPPADGH
jgi:hypothetical protein